MRLLPAVLEDEEQLEMTGNGENGGDDAMPTHISGARLQTYESLEDKRAKRLKKALELKAHFESKLEK